MTVMTTCYQEKSYPCLHQSPMQWNLEKYLKKTSDPVDASKSDLRQTEHDE